MSGDETGKHLTNWVALQVKQKKQVRIMYHYILLDLWMEDGICKGALLGNTKKHTVEWVTADAVVLATGGSGNLYWYNTNAAQANIGEGYADCSTCRGRNFRDGIHPVSSNHAV